MHDLPRPKFATYTKAVLIIGHVTAESVRDDIVTIRGHAMVDGHDTYVLKLEPRHSSEDAIFPMHVDVDFRANDFAFPTSLEIATVAKEGGVVTA